MKITIKNPSTWIQKHGYTIEYLTTLIHTELSNIEIEKRNHMFSIRCCPATSEEQERHREALQHHASFINDYETEIKRIKEGGEIKREI